MINTSALYRKEVRENTKFEIEALLTLSNSRVLTLKPNRFISNTAVYDSSVSASGVFEIGSAITKTFDVTLNNYDGYFDKYDFQGAYIQPTIKKLLSDNTYELIKLGLFFVDKPDFYGSTISLKCKDIMSHLDRDFANVQITYPATFQEIVKACCNYCGVMFNMGTQAINLSYEVKEEPEKDGLTCRSVIASIAQLCGCYAEIDTNNTLVFKWYDTTPLYKTDGGTFSTSTTPYSDGDTADGGTFNTKTTPYSDGDTIDGGTFKDAVNIYNLFSFKSKEIFTDDVVITGVKGTTFNGEKSYTYGKTDYALSIGGNPFLNEQNLQFFVKSVSGIVIGMRFRPFRGEALGDPSVQAGDRVMVFSGSTYYYSYLTHVSFKMGNYETYECSAEGALRNKSSSYSNYTKAILASKELIEREKTEREIAIQTMNQAIQNASGLYAEQKEYPDGSIGYLLYDKKTKAESQLIIEMNAGGIHFSVDGGKTYPYGFTFYDATLILNQIYAVGIDADYITSGSIDSKKIKVTNLVVGDNVTMGPKATLSWDNVTDQPKIPGKVSDLSNDTGFITSPTATQITKDTVTSTYIKAMNLQVGNEIQMGPNAVITWKNLPSDVASQSDIPEVPSDEYITEITENSIKTTNVTAKNLKVSAANVSGTLTLGGDNNTYGQLVVKDAEDKVVGRWNKDGITLPPGTKISWDNVTSKPSIPTKTSDLTNDSDFIDDNQATTITENTIKTTSVVAKNLHVKVANIDGDITAQKVNAIAENQEDARVRVSYGDNYRTAVTPSTIQSVYKFVNSEREWLRLGVSGSWCTSPLQLGVRATNYDWFFIVNPVECSVSGIDVPLNTYIGNELHLKQAPIVGSDVRLKDDIRYMDDTECLDNVLKLYPTEYVYKDNPNKYHHGFIAQDAEAVHTDKWHFVSDVKETGYKAIAYEEIIADLVGSIKALEKRIEELEKAR